MGWNGRDEWEGGSATIDVHDDTQIEMLTAFSCTSSPSWRPIRRPVARCEYCGRLRVPGEIQCAGCGVMR